MTGPVMGDINMLVNTGGRERTEKEFRGLYTAAGFELAMITGQGAGYHVLEGKPV